MDQLCRHHASTSTHTALQEALTTGRERIPSQQRTSLFGKLKLQPRRPAKAVVVFTSRHRHKHVGWGRARAPVSVATVASHHHGGGGGGGGQHAEHGHAAFALGPEDPAKFCNRNKSARKLVERVFMPLSQEYEASFPWIPGTGTFGVSEEAFSSLQLAGRRPLPSSE